MDVDSWPVSCKPEADKKKLSIYVKLVIFEYFTFNEVFLVMTKLNKYHRDGLVNLKYRDDVRYNHYLIVHARVKRPLPDLKYLIEFSNRIMLYMKDLASCVNVGRFLDFVKPEWLKNKRLCLIQDTYNEKRRHDQATIFERLAQSKFQQSYEGILIIQEPYET